MKRMLRPGDIFARYGGDEFVALLPEITVETASAVAQRVLEAAAALEFTAAMAARSPAASPSVWPSIRCMPTTPRICSCSPTT